MHLQNFSMTASKNNTDVLQNLVIVNSVNNVIEK